MRHAYWIGPVSTLAEFDQLVHHARNYGFGDFYLSDHLVPPNSSDPPCVDPWMLLERLAQTHGAKNVGVMAVPSTLHRCSTVFRSVESLLMHDDLRITVGIGAGWFAGDYDRHQKTRSPFAERIAATGSFIRRFRSLLETSTRPTAAEVKCVLAGRSRAVADLAASLGLGLNRWNLVFDSANEGTEVTYHSTQALLAPCESGDLPMKTSEVNRHGIRLNSTHLIDEWLTLISERVEVLLVPDFHIYGFEARLRFLETVGKRLSEEKWDV